jgi:4-hydroxythreonine-4-phosphate dehydrogenase
VNAVSPSAPLLITAGEPAGIGPDLCVQLAAAPPGIPLVVVADRNLLLQRAALLDIPLRVRDYSASREVASDPDILTIIHVPLLAACHAGKPDVANSPYVLATLRSAVQGCRTGKFAGMVTAPVHKGIINDAGIAFTGHTEFLAEQTGVKQVVMMLVGGGMRVALATTHLALKDVPAAITPALLESVLRIIRQDLQRRFGISQPRILVAGLNPHAGEDGYLGREEIDVMQPVLDKLRSEGMHVSAPLPADTVFTVLKHASFGQGVNVTLGLPMIRTSVDHGTALDLAGTGKADSGSMLEAIRLAAQMAQFEHLRRA